MTGGVITISTLGALVDQGCTMAAWCPTCGTRPVDLAVLIARHGRETSYIRPASPVRIRCGACGRRDLAITIGPVTPSTSPR